jgi:hypothetical protein
MRIELTAASIARGPSRSIQPSELTERRGYGA